MDRILLNRNSYTESLISNVSVFGDRAFRRQLRVNNIITVSTWFNRISIIKRRERDHNFLSAMWELSKKVAVLQARMRVLIRNQTGCYLDLGLLSLSNCEKINFCCVSHTVYGILLWQPKLTNKEMYRTATATFNLKIEEKMYVATGKKLEK